eukprot:1185464-Prorocentrum_minimum.AAC.2
MDEEAALEMALAMSRTQQEWEEEQRAAALRAEQQLFRASACQEPAASVRRGYGARPFPKTESNGSVVGTVVSTSFGAVDVRRPATTAVR